MENDRNSPATSESHTSTFRAGAKGNFSGNAGMVPAMAGMHPQMSSYYNMYNWMSGMGGMMPGAAGMGGMAPSMMGGGMTPAGMGEMMPAGMGGMMPGMQTMPGGGGSRGPHTPGENVYRSYMDLLSSDSPQSTPLETQFTGIDTFSFEELGLSPVRETPDEAGSAARDRGRSRGKGKGNGKGPASSSRTGAEEEDVEETGRRTIWSVAENVALAKAWIGVVEDPFIVANQHIDRMWHRISQGYLRWKPAEGKPHGPEQCRKQWDRLRPKLSQFAGLYQKNFLQATSGMFEEDVKNRALQQYPDKSLRFREFEHWDVFLVVKESQKFCAGVEAGWPKRT